MNHPLFELLLQGAKFTEVLDATEAYLDNPVAFIDSVQNEVACSCHYPKEDMEDKTYRRQQISDEEYQKDTDYITSLSHTGIPQVVVWPHIRRKRLICGCFVYHQHVGGIRMPFVQKNWKTLT